MARKTSRTAPAQPAARKRAASQLKLSAALAEAAWAEADAALAEALTEFDLLASATDRTARRQAMALLGQALARAARKRGLVRIGKAGAREPYDVKRHAPEAALGPRVKTVRVIAPGVARGRDVLVKARVAGLRAARR